MERIFRVCIILILLSLLVPLRIGYSAADQQIDDIELKVQDLFQKLTPEEKVGQLFLVAFQGREVTDKSEIYDIIVNRHVGGVVRR